MKTIKNNLHFVKKEKEKKDVFAYKDSPYVPPAVGREPLHLLANKVFRSHYL